MIKSTFHKFLGTSNLSVSEAMKQIDKNGWGILLLIDGDGRLLGTVTDGDIRRYLLAGGTLEDHISYAANKSPKYAYTLEEAIALYHQKNYVAIPIVSPEYKVTDLYLGECEKGKKYPALNIPVVINAGGKGTRLDPLTRVLPKPLIPVGELPIIEHIMKQFQNYQCNAFHIIVNYKRQLMKAYFAENDNAYDISWYDEESPLGTGGGLYLLKGKIEETFFFTNCDNLLKANLDSMLRFHKENHNMVTMVCAYKDFTIPYGVVEIGINGCLGAMKEKPVMSFLTNTGIYIVEPDVIQDIEGGVPMGFPSIIEMQQQKGRKVMVYPISENEWMDMGQFSELEKMRERLYENKNGIGQ